MRGGEVRDRGGAGACARARVLGRRLAGALRLPRLVRPRQTTLFPSPFLFLVFSARPLFSSFSFALLCLCCFAAAGAGGPAAHPTAGLSLCFVSTALLQLCLALPCLPRQAPTARSELSFPVSVFLRQASYFFLSVFFLLFLFFFFFFALACLLCSALSGAGGPLRFASHGGSGTAAQPQPQPQSDLALVGPARARIIYGHSQVEIEACDVQFCTIAATFGTPTSPRFPPSFFLLDFFLALSLFVSAGFFFGFFRRSVPKNRLCNLGSRPALGPASRLHGGLYVCRERVARQTKKVLT